MTSVLGIGDVQYTNLTPPTHSSATLTSHICLPTSSQEVLVVLGYVIACAVSL